MKEIILKYTEKLNTNMAGLAKLLGVPLSNLCRWSYGQRVPGGEYLSTWYQSGGWMKEFSIDILLSIKKQTQ